VLAWGRGERVRPEAESERIADLAAFMPAVCLGQRRPVLAVCGGLDGDEDLIFEHAQLVLDGWVLERARAAQPAAESCWSTVAKRCQHIVGVGVGYFPTAATSGFYRYTRSCTSQVQVGNHRRTRKAPGNWRHGRRRKRERIGTCAARPGRLRLYGPS
jgi:hypothetical protein